MFKFFANLVNTRVAEIMKYQLHGASNPLLSVKSIKKKRRKEVLVISNCYSQSNLLISIFKCILDYNNCEKYSQTPFVIYEYTNEGVK